MVNKYYDDPILLKANSGVCLALEGNPGETDKMIHTQCDKHNSAQLFYYDPDTKGIKSYHNNYCLARWNTDQVKAAKCNKVSTESQRKWYYDPVTKQIKNWDGLCKWSLIPSSFLSSCFS